MSEQWMMERLEWWIKTARGARVSEHNSTRGTTVYGFVYDRSKHYSDLRLRSEQTRSIIARVLQRDDVPNMMRRSDDAYWVDKGIEFAEVALAVLKTREETTSMLGATAPTMKADALHSLVWGAASKRWDSGHYSDAIQRAATALSGHVKDLVGRYELGDSDLMTQAFSIAEPQEGKPRLRWPGPDNDLTVKAMRMGILNTAQGVFSAIRNPISHSMLELEKQEALEQLAVLSVLARWIDGCELVRFETLGR